MGKAALNILNMTFKLFSVFRLLQAFEILFLSKASAPLSNIALTG